MTRVHIALITILVTIIGIIIAHFVLMKIKSNKKLFDKLSKYFHLEAVIYISGVWIGNPVRDYLKGESFLYSFGLYPIFVAIILFVDFLIKKLWK